MTAPDDADRGGRALAATTLAIAVSGGVDSMTLAHVAHRPSRPGAVLMVHALSPAVPAEATARVRDACARGTAGGSR